MLSKDEFFEEFKRMVAVILPDYTVEKLENFAEEAPYMDFVSIKAPNAGAVDFGLNDLYYYHEKGHPIDTIACLFLEAYESAREDFRFQIYDAVIKEIWNDNLSS